MPGEDHLHYMLLHILGDLRGIAATDLKTDNVDLFYILSLFPDKGPCIPFLLPCLEEPGIDLLELYREEMDIGIKFRFWQNPYNSR